MKKTLFSALAIILMLTLNSPGENSILFANKEVISSAAVDNMPTYNIKAADAEILLLEGNKRYVENNASKKDISLKKRKELNIKGQHPLAVIVSCSDSRVPPEIVFDQGLGDLFVIRNAGNVSDPVVLGSVEYGAEHLNTPLIVVLGHENCGAVKAVVDGAVVDGNLNSILEKIKPTCQKLKSAEEDKVKLLDKCIDANIKNTMAEIKNSPVISRLEKENKVKVIGAKYHMESGKVVLQ